MGAAGFYGALIGTKSLFCFRSVGCRFESYAAHRTPPFFALCGKKHQQQKTPRAQQYKSSLVIPCAHAKLNFKHHRTTPKPEIHTSITAETGEAALARIKSTKTTTGGAVAAVPVYTYIRVYTSEVDFHETGMYGGSVRVWVNTWDVFRRTSPQGGRGRRAAVDLFGAVLF